MASKKQFKVTYSTMGANLEKFHRDFDRALEKVKASFGKTYPHVINNQEVAGSGAPIATHSPIDVRLNLANFHQATVEEMQSAVAAAKQAFPAWGNMNYRKRAKLMRRAAKLIRESKYVLGAIMSLEAGKSRFEAMGDAEESADLIDYYAEQLVSAKGFSQPLGRLSPNERTRSVLRPYGVWAVIAPFNFPLALSAGMSAGALLGGNTVIFKPSRETLWTGYMLAEIYRAAGLPEGVFNFIAGDRAIGSKLIEHPDLDGIVFTGSKSVGMQLFHNFSKDFIRPVLVEMGGKNPAIVMPSADLEMAAEGVMRSAFGLQGQKCSACSRVYVHEKVKEEFMKLLLEKTAKITIGDPSQRDVYMGPVIHQRARDKFLATVEEAQKGGGKIVAGGNALREGEYAHGYFVQPTIIDGLPLDHPLFYEELFLPILTVGQVRSLAEAIQLSNKAEYGLTACIFSGKKKEIQYFFEHIEAGVTYANRRTGATTGAWPGVNSFCGWKGSGGSGKGGCGPYYVQQFMREQSRTLMK
ncbi:aldehyde dehydrogenase family protein [candidate division KSB1 bacterium]|nr:aldehyde dehydrogenase family protein [candidate division KSB1 bacterium]